MLIALYGVQRPGAQHEAPHHLRKARRRCTSPARWKKWHAEERAAVLAGPHGSVLAELFRMLENLKHV